MPGAGACLWLASCKIRNRWRRPHASAPPSAGPSSLTCCQVSVFGVAARSNASAAHVRNYMHFALINAHFAMIMHHPNLLVFAGLRLGRQGQSASPGAAPSPLMSHMDHILLLDQVCCGLRSTMPQTVETWLKCCEYVHCADSHSAWLLWGQLEPRLTLCRRVTGQRLPRISSSSWGATSRPSALASSWTGLRWAATAGERIPTETYLSLTMNRLPTRSGSDRQRPRLPSSSAWAPQSICSYRRQLRRRVAPSCRTWAVAFATAGRQRGGCMPMRGPSDTTPRTC
jgi:hypothetical protein